MDAPKRVWKKEYTYICIFYIKYMLYVTYMLYICIYVLNKYIHIYKYKQSYTHTCIYTYILYIYIKARHLFIQKLYVSFFQTFKESKVWKKPTYNFWINKYLVFLYIYFDICKWHTTFKYICKWHTTSKYCLFKNVFLIFLF